MEKREKRLEGHVNVGIKRMVAFLAAQTNNRLFDLRDTCTAYPLKYKKVNAQVSMSRTGETMESDIDMLIKQTTIKQHVHGTRSHDEDDFFSE
jgi:hypothetical protein